MPYVVWFEQADDVAGPATHEVGLMHHRVEHVAASPVVSDNVDGFIDALQLVNEPITVGDISCWEGERQRGTESRR